jgi:small subunit ribosomal protein S14
MKQRRFFNDNKKRNLYKKTEVLQKLLKVLSLYKKIQYPSTLLVSNLFFSRTLKNTFKSRIHNYCIITGRARGVYRKLRVSRISLRQLGSEGLYFGLKKAS